MRITAALTFAFSTFFMVGASADATCITDYLAKLRPLLHNVESIGIISPTSLATHQAALGQYFKASKQLPDQCEHDPSISADQLTETTVDVLKAHLLFVDELLYVADSSDSCRRSAYAAAAVFVAQNVFILEQKKNDVNPTPDMKAAVSKTFRYAAETHVLLPNLCCDDGDKHVYLKPYEDAYDAARSNYCENAFYGPNRTVILGH